jgi:hypothetical protein
MPRKTISRSPIKGHRMQQLRNLRQTFMIFTEGETEEGYFKQFKVRCKTVKGGHALKIVEEAIVQKKNLKRAYDQYWVVLDKDNTSVDDFLKAIQLAERNKMRVAYSCDAFEIWWLFHFMQIKSPIPPKEYERKIKIYIKEYSLRNKGLQQGETMWLMLNEKLKTAIINAKKAHNQFSSPKDTFNQSVTTEYQLAEILNNQNRF